MLVCNTHKTVDRLPDYDTANDMEGKHDHHLKEAIGRHLDKFGADPGKHKSLIIRVEDDELALIDPKRLEQAVHDNRLEKFLQEERSQLKEDALRCYQLHNRPTYGIGYGVGCQDYMNESRVVARVKGRPRSEWTYLCQFCPYNSYVEHAKDKASNYKRHR